MGVKFLSDEWFAKVAELTEEAGDIEVPAPLAELTVNMTVATDDGEKKVHMAKGVFQNGHADGAPATIILPADLAKQLFIEGDTQAGMQAFMSGQMQVEGDVSQLMVLQSVQPTDDMKDLADEIKGITD